MFAAEEFFSLAGFSHASLWRAETLVWEPLLSIKKYLENQSYKIESPIPASVTLLHSEWIAIGKGVQIDPGVLIEGPCVIGNHCHIRHGAFLRGPVILGDHCTVGHGSELKNAIFLNHATAAHLCYVGDTILGSYVNLGAGVKCSNLRLDRKEISIQGIKTGLKKFGAILGEGVQVGCNCVLNPGTLVGKKTVIHPLLNLGGIIPEKSVVKGIKNWTVEPMIEKILERILP